MFLPHEFQWKSDLGRQEDGVEIKLKVVTTQWTYLRSHLLSEHCCSIVVAKACAQCRQEEVEVEQGREMGRTLRWVWTLDRGGGREGDLAKEQNKQNQHQLQHVMVLSH